MTRAALDRFHPAQATEAFDVPQSLTYNWQYENTRRRLVRLYENAKRDQWNATERLDWSIDVDPEAGLVPDMGIGIYGTPMWDKLSDAEVRKLRHEAITWQLCQFLHGEQGALMTAAALTHAVPDYEGKLYAATQTMDEARHVEAYQTYIDKLAIVYPISPWLKETIDVTLTADRWVKIAIGMNMVVEGLALAAFHNMRRTTTCDLLRQIVELVLRDESRHVAFGVLSLEGVYRDMTAAELREREDFIIEATYLMRDRLLMEQVYERMGWDVKVWVGWAKHTPFMTGFRQMLFSKIVPNLKRLGLLTPRVRAAYEKHDLLRFEHLKDSVEEPAVQPPHELVELLMQSLNGGLDEDRIRDVRDAR